MPTVFLLRFADYKLPSRERMDIDIQAQEILKIRELLNGILASHTGQDLDRITQDTDRDYFMSAAEACEYGLIDEVITRKELAER